ncbi:hypothetical protein C475_11710 [Halosimplex carlsbadense 2-9-1]|uniref:HTH cro/C1-type domain-containing protein n=1 Tax=Halosimplex carlsbadense 2-9-1 TaxID=797114 RepID=M0CNS5_9EURY|nr:helix-turn-helix transcriptional regulator [Halosimplex carlsbadense]ELZ24901.1 hypothetical protein C475_11710 [Halosimplex carlsbadense 2-9-1]
MSVEAPKRFFRESDHPLAEMYRKRVEQDRDLVILITDSSNDRGTGKTTEALRLAHGMDRTDDGVTPEKVALNPHPLIQAYTEEPRGSSLVLDESEVGIDKYKAGSAVNRAIRELVSTGRIEEKYLVLNAPADHLVDQDLKTLVDVWVLVERRGFANVYRMDWNPHQGHELTHNMGTLTWDPIPNGSDLHSVYQHLTEKKEARLRGEEGDDFVKRSEAQDMVEQAQKEAEKGKRNQLIRAMVENGLTQTQTADIVGLDQTTVSKIVNS